MEEPQNRRTRMSLGTKGLKVNLFPGLSPSALKVPSDHSRNIQPPGLLATLRPAFSSFPHPLLPIPPLILLSRKGPQRSLCAPLDPVLCAKWYGRKNKVCSCPRTSQGSEVHEPWP